MNSDIKIRIGTLHSRKSGQTLTLTTLVLPVFIAIIGLAADTGNLYLNQLKLQMAVDTAVLSGAACLPDEGSCDSVATANNYAAQNGTLASDTVTGPAKGAGNTSITMSVGRIVPFYFAALVGVNKAALNVTATAQTGPVGVANNALPLGLQACGSSIAVCTTPYSVGEALTFAAKANDGSGAWLSGSGDWSAVSLSYPTNTVTVCASPDRPCISSDPGFTNVQTIIGDVNNLISQGMRLDPSGTATSHTANDPRAVPVPLVDWSVGGSGCNGSCKLNVYGFAEIWLTGAVDNGSTASYITAQFISQSIHGFIDRTGTAQDVGAYAVALSQ